MNLLVPHHLNTRLVERPVRHNFVAAEFGDDLVPEQPVDGTKEENTDTHNWEDVVRVAVGGPAALGWEEGHEDEEEVGHEPEDGDGKVGVPWRRPVFRLCVLQVDQTSPDEGINPRSRVGITDKGSVNNPHDMRLFPLEGKTNEDESRGYMGGIKLTGSQ